MDIVFIVVLILLNGLFAMSEMALSSSRKVRLLALQEAGEPGADKALQLMERPTQFLSTIQIGITSIGVLNGIVGESAFSAGLSQWLQSVSPLVGRTADKINAPCSDNAKVVAKKKLTANMWAGL